MARFDLDARPVIRALLGPTNTGKTHRAVRRMLAHRSGMIGLPLRLLAREVYDRVSEELGEGAVALVTGEEKRVPAAPRFWICTVESMPVDRMVDFLAIDEVQLMAHPERGHTFTDRVLHARGSRETWFLGSDTVSAILQELVPTVEIEGFPRFSRLSWAGHKRLASLPARSAVVAFSVAEVYQLAEKLRRLQGGTAVVLGALSPRTRNAQVAMYQAGEVPTMVATDAIGMGLNMDVQHVAFGALTKFDGRGVRGLEAPELAQIAGRAGRYKRDGTFGTTGDLEGMDPDLAEAIEGHRFPGIRRIYWRSRELDFSNLLALQQSLATRPPRPFMARPRRADDTDTLDRLAAHPEVLDRATTPERVALLWRVCQVPDFRKSLFEAHVSLMREAYVQLVDRGRLDPVWLGERIDRLDRTEGEVDALMTRIAWVRTWTFISHRGAWLDDPGAWQARTREIEDRLSDALHERLTHRFVDKKAMVLTRALAVGGDIEAHVRADGVVVAAGAVLGRLEGLGFTVEAGSSAEAARAARRAARAGLGSEIEARVEGLVIAPHAALRLGAEGAILWEGAAVGRLVAGADRRSPSVRLPEWELVGPGARQRISRRLVAWARDLVAELLAPLRLEEGLSPAGRGLVWAVEQGMGMAPVSALQEQLRGLSRSDSDALARQAVRIGQRWVWSEALLRPAAIRARAALWLAWSGVLPAPALPEGAPPSFELPGRPPEGFLEAAGYLRLGKMAVRVDAAEGLARQLRGLSPGPFALPEGAAQRLGCPPGALHEIIVAMGYLREEDGRFRRPAPPAPPQRRRAPRQRWGP